MQCHFVDEELEAAVGRGIVVHDLVGTHRRRTRRINIHGGFGRTEAWQAVLVMP
jgi:hypothetical protein